MSNMSYCMFENTLKDLQDCVHRMEEAENMKDLEMNEQERYAFYSMWRVCRDFMAEHERLLIEEGVSE